MERLLRISEASKLAGISERMLRRLIASGDAPEVVRLGRVTRVRASDLDLWMKLGCPDRERLAAARNGGHDA